LSQITRLTDAQTDRWTDGRTDRMLIARPRLHSMQRGKKYTANVTRLCSFWKCAKSDGQPL